MPKEGVLILPYGQMSINGISATVELGRMEIVQKMILGIYLGVCRKIEFILVFNYKIISCYFESPLRTISKSRAVRHGPKQPGNITKPGEQSSGFVFFCPRASRFVRAGAFGRSGIGLARLGQRLFFAEKLGADKGPRNAGSHQHAVADLFFQKLLAHIDPGQAADKRLDGVLGFRAQSAANLIEMVFGLQNIIKLHTAIDEENNRHDNDDSAPKLLCSHSIPRKLCKSVPVPVFHTEHAIVGSIAFLILVLKPFPSLRRFLA